MGANRTSQMIAALVLLAMILTSCNSEADDPAAGDGRTAAVYESILEWMLEEEPTGGTDGEESVMFVATRSEEEIDLDVQVAVVEALEPSTFVRFIDERTEAVDEDTDTKPVRDGGILVGLGAVAQDGDTVEVYADRYRNSGDIEAWLVTLRRSGDAWGLVGVPVGAEVRPLPSGT